MIEDFLVQKPTSNFQIQGTGTTCNDRNECTDGTADAACSIYAVCTNTVGSYTCACASGMTGDGTTCTDVDECAASTDDCGTNASCSNTTRKFRLPKAQNNFGVQWSFINK